MPRSACMEKGHADLRAGSAASACAPAPPPLLALAPRPLCPPAMSRRLGRRRQGARHMARPRARWAPSPQDRRLPCGPSHGRAPPPLGADAGASPTALDSSGTGATLPPNAAKALGAPLLPPRLCWRRPRAPLAFQPRSLSRASFRLRQTSKTPALTPERVRHHKRTRLDRELARARVSRALHLACARFVLDAA